jgi:hypothetical protein
MDRDMRDRFKDSEFYDYTAEFIAKYDNPAFDDSKPALSLDLFAPVVRKVMAEPRNSLYKEALDRSK